MVVNCGLDASSSG